jgi:2-oxoacid:acceptor oxidoreductase delta subunit (pyruvate/2-ketoisovalerate family)
MKFITKGEVAWASCEEQFVIDTKEWRHQKPVTDKNRCNDCGICSLFCASGCIEEKEDHYVVDLEYCKGCGVCARLCPREAIRMEMESS